MPLYPEEKMAVTTLSTTESQIDPVPYRPVPQAPELKGPRLTAAGPSSQATPGKVVRVKQYGSWAQEPVAFAQRLLPPLAHWVAWNSVLLAPPQSLRPVAVCELATTLKWKVELTQPQDPLG